MTLIDNFLTDVLTIKRYGTGEYSNGDYTPGSITQIVVNASIQPIKGKELMNLPEAQRTREMVRVYTDTQLFTADDVNNKRADRFEYNNKEYEIQKVERWVNTDIPHYKSIAVKTDSFESERI